MALLPLSSCTGREGPTSWPPIAAKAHTEFVENRDELRRLHSLIEQSGYWSVGRLGDDEIRAFLSIDDPTQYEVPSDSEQWLSLMSVTNVNVVNHSDDMYTFVTETQLFDGDSFQGIVYVYTDYLPAKACAERFRRVACGICDVYRANGWTVRYTWSSGEFVEDYFRSAKGDILSDSYTTEGQVESFRQFNATNLACLRDGLEEMGYENASDYF